MKKQNYRGFGFYLALVAIVVIVWLMLDAKQNAANAYTMTEFKAALSAGNLDIPLEMDRQNLFGAFTESFDIMRSELKRAQLAEAEANASKKELVAKLSHDIKTPVASIKAVSELGAALADRDRDKENYIKIINKAGQINTLVTNLFTAALDELKQLSVVPSVIESGEIKEMIQSSDYFGYASVPEIPGPCSASRLREQARSESAQLPL